MEDKNVSWFGDGFALSYEVREKGAMTKQEMEQGIRFQCMKMASEYATAYATRGIEVDAFKRADEMYCYIMEGKK